MPQPGTLAATLTEVEEGKSVLVYNRHLKTPLPGMHCQRPDTPWLLTLQVILRRFAARHRCSCALLASVLRLLRPHTHERCEAVVALWGRLTDRNNILSVSIPGCSKVAHRRHRRQVQCIGSLCCSTHHCMPAARGGCLSTAGRSPVQPWK
jgi:hypothetical protein